MRGKTIILSKRSIKRVAVALLLLQILSATGYGNSYKLISNTIDGGSGVSVVVSFRFVVTMGEPEFGAMICGLYELVGGF